MIAEVKALAAAAQSGQFEVVRDYFAGFQWKDYRNAKYYQSLAKSVELAWSGSLLAALATLYEGDDDCTSNVEAYNAAHLLVAEACEKAGDLQLALYNLEHVESPDEEDLSWLRTLRVQVKLDQADVDRAVSRRMVQYYEAKVGKRPRDSMLLGSLAFWVEEFDEDRAVDLANRALEINPAQRESVGLLVSRCLLRGEFEHSAQIVERARKIKRLASWVRDLAQEVEEARQAAEARGLKDGEPGE